MISSHWWKITLENMIFSNSLYVFEKASFFFFSNLYSEPQRQMATCGGFATNLNAPFSTFMVTKFTFTNIC